MKNLLASIVVLVGLFCAGSVFAYSSPGKPVGHINDYTGTLSEDTKARLEAFLFDLKNAGKGEVAVAIIPTLAGDPIEDYANTLGREWGIGSKETSNGILLLVAKDDRELRIEVGYGMEGDLTDLKSHRIIDEVIVPRFKEGNYDKGVEDGVREIVGVVAPGFVGSTQRVDYSTVPKKSNSNLGPYFLFIFIVLWVVLGSTKDWFLGGIFGGVLGTIVTTWGGWWGLSIFIIPFSIALGLLFDFLASKAGINRGSRFGGGGSSGGSSGSSFGGFSGGSFGGGGASGKW